MRLGFDRLTRAVCKRLAEDPGNSGRFMFANRRTIRLKILWFHRSAYFLLYKRFQGAVCDVRLVRTDRRQFVSITPAS